MLQDPGSAQNFAYMVLARRFDNFIIPATPEDIHELESKSGIAITSLNGLKEAEQDLSTELAEGMRAVKSAIAYYRELRFEEVEEQDAQKDFDALIERNARYRKASELPWSGHFATLKTTCSITS